MEEFFMEEKESVLVKYYYLFAALLGLLVFIGFAFPLVNYHPFSYDAVNWTFEDSERIKAGVGVLFGDGVFAWALLYPYILVIAGVVLSVLSKLNKKLLMPAMILYFVAGMHLLLADDLFAFSYAFNSRIPYLEELREYQSEYWFMSEAQTVIDSRLEAGAILSIVFAFMAGVFNASISFSKESVSVRDITETGVLLAIAIVLDIIFHYIPNLPMQVGSISIACLPLMIIALRQGAAKGFLASTLFGLITCVIDGYGLWLYPLDYFVAFSGVAVIGLFKDKIFIEGNDKLTFKIALYILGSSLIAGIIRLLGSGVSSIVNYGYTVNAAILVNLYCLISAVICGIILVVAYKPLAKLNQRFTRH